MIIQHYIDKEGRPGDEEYDYSNSDDEAQVRANLASYVSDEEDQGSNKKYRLERYARQSEQKLNPHTTTPGDNGDYDDFNKMHMDVDERIIPLIEKVIIPEFTKAGISSEREKDRWLWFIITNPLGFHFGALLTKYLQMKLPFGQIYNMIKRSTSYEACFGLGLDPLTGPSTADGEEDHPMVAGFNKVEMVEIYHARGLKALGICLMNNSNGVAWLAMLMQFFIAGDKFQTPGYDNKHQNTDLWRVLGRLTITKLIKNHHAIFKLFIKGAGYSQPYKLIIFVWLYKLVMPFIRYPLIRELWFHLEYDAEYNEQGVDLNHKTIVQILDRVCQDIKVNRLGLVAVPHNSLVMK